MNIDRIVFAFAGTMILVSLALGMQVSPLYHHDYWLYFTAFIGANLLQSSLTGFCPLVNVLKLFGAKPGQAYS